MPTLAIRLDPRLLNNPDADLRYRLPDLLVERSGGLMDDDGYDYVGENALMVVFLKTTDTEASLAHAVHVIENVPLLGNDLKAAAVIALDRGDGYKVAYPPGFAEPFLST